MNEKTEQLVRELAEKLGTTIEHLWSVLVRHAVIQSIVGLVIIAGLIIVGTLWTRFLLKSTTSEDPRWPFDDEIPAILIWAITSLGWLVIVIVVLEKLPVEITALMNPEYWALKQLLP